MYPPKPHPARKEGRKEGRGTGRQEGRKAGRKEGQTKPGSLSDSSGRKVSRITSPKHPVKSKATKTKITSRNKTGVLLFLLFAVGTGKDCILTTLLWGWH